jgi:pentapeptide MXKDX repeat protein
MNKTLVLTFASLAMIAATASHAQDAMTTDSMGKDAMGKDAMKN